MTRLPELPPKMTEAALRKATKAELVQLALWWQNAGAEMVSVVDELQSENERLDEAYSEMETEVVTKSERVEELESEMEGEGKVVVSCDATARPYPLVTVEMRSITAGEAMLTMLPGTPL